MQYAAAFRVLCCWKNKCASLLPHNNRLEGENKIGLKWYSMSSYLIFQSCCVSLSTVLNQHNHSQTVGATVLTLHVCTLSIPSVCCAWFPNHSILWFTQGMMHSTPLSSESFCYSSKWTYALPVLYYLHSVFCTQRGLISAEGSAT